MKKVIDNLVEVSTLVDQIAEYEYEGMGTIICMLIDTAAAKYHKPVDSILDEICQIVRVVNAEIGPYIV